MWIDFIKSVIVGFCGSIVIGPVGILCIQRTINKGKVSGLISGSGAAAADTLFSALAIFGLAAIQSIIESNESVFYIAGGLIVIFIGAKIHFTNPIKQVKKKTKSNKFRFVEDFVSTFFLTLTNPMFIFFMMGLFALVQLDLTTRTNSSSSVFLVLWGVFVGTFLWWLLLVSIINRYRKKFRLKQLWIINKIFGIIIFVLGIISIFEGIWIAVR